MGFFLGSFMSKEVFFEDQAPELLLDLATQIEMSLVKDRLLSKEDARHFGIAMAQKMADDWGGLMIYIPKNLKNLLSSRDIQMYREFNGRNHWQLAKKYKLSMAQVYVIISKMRELEVKRTQPDLF